MAGDLAGAVALLWWVLARDGFAIVTSATEDELTRQIFRGELRRLLDGAGDKIKGLDLYPWGSRPRGSSPSARGRHQGDDPPIARQGRLPGDGDLRQRPRDRRSRVLLHALVHRGTE